MFYFARQRTYALVLHVENENLLINKDFFFFTRCSELPRVFKNHKVLLSKCKQAGLRGEIFSTATLTTIISFFMTFLYYMECLCWHCRNIQMFCTIQMQCKPAYKPWALCFLLKMSGHVKNNLFCFQQMFDIYTDLWRLHLLLKHLSTST